MFPRPLSQPYWGVFEALIKTNINILPVKHRQTCWQLVYSLCHPSVNRKHIQRVSHESRWDAVESPLIFSVLIRAEAEALATNLPSGDCGSFPRLPKEGGDVWPLSAMLESVLVRLRLGWSSNCITFWYKHFKRWEDVVDIAECALFPLSIWRER